MKTLTRIGMTLSALIFLAAPSVRAEDVATYPKTLPAKTKAMAPQLSAEKTVLVPFESAPFPYSGRIGGQDKPFLDVVRENRKGHNSPRGGIYWEDVTYSDSRVMLSIPRGFNPLQPSLIILFLHGNEARLEKDVRDRQRVTQQVAASGLNAVLVAPQFAVNALDSSAGKFWERGHLAKFLIEASHQLALVAGNNELHTVFDRAPVVIVAYSGGYLPAAFSLQIGEAGNRIHGLIMLDALFGEEDRFADWLSRRQNAFFFSAYSSSSRSNNAKLEDLLSQRGIAFQSTIPPRFAPGSVSFQFAGNSATHRDFVTQAWVADPLRAALSRIVGFQRLQQPDATTLTQVAPKPVPLDPSTRATSSVLPHQPPAIVWQQIPDFSDFDNFLRSDKADR